VDINLFRPCNQSGAGGSIAVSGSNQNTTPDFQPSPKQSMSILITNSGTDVVMVEFGANASATTSTPILPNDKQIFSWIPGETFGVIGVAGSGSTAYWKLGYGA
jgi:hypothetical protein